MINKKFSDFLFESLINESIVEFSRKFDKIISTIKSPVAVGLQSIENNDHKVVNNFIDVGDANDTISFIPDKKAQQLLQEVERKTIYTGDDRRGILKDESESNKDLFDLIGYTPGRRFTPSNEEAGEVIKEVVSPTSGNTYCHMKFPGGECVINKTHIRFEEIVPDVWKKLRQSVKIGRGVKALLKAAGISVTDAEIEKFVNDYKAAYEKANDAFRSFEVISGEKIRYWYNCENYSRISGTLGSSCMSGRSCSGFFGIYEDNPSVCSLLILHPDDDEDTIKGRALVWTVGEGDNKYTFMDRVYSVNDSDVNLFRLYAREHGWFAKYYNDSSDTASCINPNGGTTDKGEIFVTIKSGTYDAYPYVDTLKYYNEHSGYLGTKSSRGTTELTDTDGGGGGCSNCGGSGEVECSECNGRGTEECSECSGSGEVECNECRGKGKVDCGTCDGDGECQECEGTGKVDGEDCEECGGTGKCSDCEGSGKIECSECSGSGEKECDDCNGQGRVSCEECGGSGEVECYECQ